jgi:small-conductance mechanosensitive channel
MDNASNASTPLASVDPGSFDRVWTDAIAWMGNNSVAILVALAVAAAIVFLLLGIRSLGVRACRNDRLGTGWPGVFGRVIARTHFWFMIALAAEVVERHAAPPAELASVIQTVFTIAAALQAAIWARELVLGIIDKRTNVGAENHAFGSAVGLIKVLISIAFFAIAVVLILDNLGVNVTGLVAGLGIGGIAIGLAAQGIFSDLFAALSMIFDKPFEVGDTINFDQTTGTVDRIGLKSTRIRSTNGEMIAISNAKLLEKELRNYSQFDHRRFVINLAVIYQTSPEACRRLPDIVSGVIAEHEECTLIRCALSGFGASSLDFELLFDVRAEAPADPFLIRSDVFLRILDRFKEEGIEFAYPTQTTFTAAPDGTMIMPYAPARLEKDVRV